MDCLLFKKNAETGLELQIDIDGKIRKIELSPKIIEDLNRFVQSSDENELPRFTIVVPKFESALNGLAFRVEI